MLNLIPNIQRAKQKGAHHLHQDGHYESRESIDDKVQRRGDCIGDVGVQRLVQHKLAHEHLFKFGLVTVRRGIQTSNFQEISEQRLR